MKTTTSDGDDTRREPYARVQARKTPRTQRVAVFSYQRSVVCVTNNQHRHRTLTITDYHNSQGCIEIQCTLLIDCSGPRAPGALVLGYINCV